MAMPLDDVFRETVGQPAFDCISRASSSSSSSASGSCVLPFPNVHRTSTSRRTSVTIFEEEESNIYSPLSAGQVLPVEQQRCRATAPVDRLCNPVRHAKSYTLLSYRTVREQSKRRGTGVVNATEEEEEDEAPARSCKYRGLVSVSLCGDMCACVSVYVCVHVCACARMRVHLCACGRVGVRACVCACVWACGRVGVWACVVVCVRGREREKERVCVVCVWLCMHIHMCMCVRATAMYSGIMWMDSVLIQSNHQI